MSSSVFDSLFPKKRSNIQYLFVEAGRIGLRKTEIEPLTLLTPPGRSRGPQAGSLTDEAASEHPPASCGSGPWGRCAPTDVPSACGQGSSRSKHRERPQSAPGCRTSRGSPRSARSPGVFGRQTPVSSPQLGQLHKEAGSFWLDQTSTCHSAGPAAQCGHVAGGLAAPQCP